MAGKLSEPDHALMDKFLARIFEDVRAQSLGKIDFVETIALVITAVDIGEHGEALRCFKEREQRGGGTVAVSDLGRSPNVVSGPVVWAERKMR